MDRGILAVVLFQNELLTAQDMEHLELPTMIESKRINYVYLKMVQLGEEDYKKFLSCLKHPYASQHAGHIRLHEILSTSQQWLLHAVHVAAMSMLWPTLSDYRDQYELLTHACAVSLNSVAS